MAAAIDAKGRTAVAAALEALRASTLAVHAAVGLTLPASRQAARLARTAEGLLRTAVSLLTAAPPEPRAVPAPAASAASGPASRRRPRRSRAKRNEEMKCDDVTADDADAPMPSPKQLEDARGPEDPSAVSALPHPVFVAAAGAGSTRGASSSTPSAASPRTCSAAPWPPLPVHFEYFPPDAKRLVAALRAEGVPFEAVKKLVECVSKRGSRWKPPTRPGRAPTAADALLHQLGTALRDNT